jgi:pilus assembly protein Flp/PilA
LIRLTLSKTRIIIKVAIALGLIKEGGKIMKCFTAEKGQGLVEYALILVFVAIVVIVILALFGPAIGAVFSNVIETI